MHVTINGEARELEEANISITRLLEVNQVEAPEMVSVQLNGKVIERAQYERITVSEHDEIDFLYFMGGGAR